MICVKVRKDCPVPPTTQGQHYRVIENKKNESHNVIYREPDQDLDPAHP